MSPAINQSAKISNILTTFFRRHRTVLIVALLWSLSLRWWDGERMWGSHSPAFEPVRMMGVVDAWKHGILDARWIPLFDQGYGYPIFSYHSPLFSWVGAVFLVVTGLPVLSLKLTIMTFFLVGGYGCRTLAAHFWARPGTRDFQAGNVAFIGWASATYLFTNIFVRGSLAEFAASCFAPWVLWGFWLLTSDARRYVQGASVIAVSLGLVILSHNAIAVYMFLLCILPLPLLLRPCGWRGWLSWATGGAFAVCLTAFFAIAAAQEQSFVRLDKVAIQDVRDHFLRLDHLLSFDQWNLGLSGQDPACTMPRHQGALLPLALLSAAAAFRIFRANSLRKKTAVALALAGLTLVMAMPPSVWLWDHVRILQYTQFPWRWLSLNAVMLALVAPAFAVALRLHGSEVAQHCYSVILGAVLVLNVGLYGGPTVKWPRWKFDPRPELVRSDKARTALADEYGPTWRPTEFTHPVAADALLAPGATITKASTPGSPWRWKISQQQPNSPVVMGVNFFPAWKAYWSASNGSARKELPVENASGLVGVKVPDGSPGVLELEFGNTPRRTFLKVFSLASLVLGLGLLFWLRRRDKAGQQHAADRRSTAQEASAATYG